MSRLFYHVMQDNLGNLLFGVTGTMRLAGTGTLATIYGDEALTVILPNPMTNHPSFASFKCFLGAGDYDFYMAKGGYTFETLTGVQGHGTMAQQDASAVAITGGTAALTTLQVGQLSSAWYGSPAQGIYINDAPAGARQGLLGLITAGTDRYNLYIQGSAPNYFAGNVGIGAPPATERLSIGFSGGISALVTRPAVAGTVYPLFFVNSGGGNVGSISTTDTATAYNTTSDVRLKHAIAPLTDALAVVQALRPVAFRWNADESVGHGFLAHELQAAIPDAVTGQPEEVNPDGSIKPQQVDNSKLVVWLTACCQELAQQVQTLTARVASLEAQLGV